MFERLRKVFGPTVVGVIIGAIALVFVFYGVYSPSQSGGIGSGAMAASVNGDEISWLEFEGEYQRRIEYYQSLFKGKVDHKVLEQLGIRQQILEELINRKLLFQQAKHYGILISDAEVREKIQELPYFKEKKNPKDEKEIGQFSTELYKKILKANNRTPSEFEELIRTDLLRERLLGFLKSLVKISDAEIEKEFSLQQNLRQIEYVLLNQETAAKRMMVSQKEIEDFLKNSANLEAAKQHYEQRKISYIKSQDKKTPKSAPKKDKQEYYSFEEVKQKIATELIRSKRTDEILKINKDLSQEVFAKAKELSLEKFKSYLKSKDLELKTSEKFHYLQRSVGTLGEWTDLIEHAFQNPSLLAKEPKLYENANQFLIVKSLNVFKPQVLDLSKDREKISRELLSKKEEQFFNTWLTEIRSQSKIKINKNVEKGGAES